jgi:FtsH-binding integral membrane protein
MYVPNYVPEPLEVPGNVTLAPYAVRVRFIRKVTLLHLISMALVFALAMTPIPPTGWLLPAAVLSGLLLLLDLLRIQLRGKPLEAPLSGMALPGVILAAAWLAEELCRTAVPVGFMVAGPLCCGIYTLACGRDYSFVGCFFLSLIASTTALAALANQLRLPSGTTEVGLAMNAAYLTYFVYDLASLMARRRRGEEPAAVVDLYRDVFNIFGYLVRIVGHWKRHKIWVPPHG